MQTIGIWAESASSGLQATFDALGDAFGVSFKWRPFADDPSVDGWIVIGADRRLALLTGQASRPCYVVLDQAELEPGGRSRRLSFANRAELPSVLRGQECKADDVIGARVLPHWLANVSPLAFKDGSPVWASLERGTHRHHYVTLPPPELENGQPLFTHLGGQRIACLLPLVLFLRGLTADDSWEPPPLQAAFMIDDPNLHWTSYGFVNYAEMIRHAAVGDYHVAVATIPLDAWFVHPPTRAIFKDNASRISLLYHGNDHVLRELGRRESANALERRLLQAISRIRAMEARTGLEVSRVMAPPHGACSENALVQMARTGFEAVCVSRGSLWHHNNGSAWTRTLGMKSCDMIAGLTVIPRFRLSPDCHNDIMVAAVLGQPIVPVTHHQGVADGYDLFDQTASFVNSLGPVLWRDLKSVSRSLYSRKQLNGILSVRMMSSRISVPVPPATALLRIERPWLDDPAAEPLSMRTGRDPRWRIISAADGVAIEAGETVEIVSGRLAEAPTAAFNARPPRLGPMARRLLTEVRDRALPSFRRASRTMAARRSA